MKIKSILEDWSCYEGEFLDSELTKSHHKYWYSLKVHTSPYWFLGLRSSLKGFWCIGWDQGQSYDVARCHSLFVYTLRGETFAGRKFREEKKTRKFRDLLLRMAKWILFAWRKLSRIEGFPNKILLIFNSAIAMSYWITRFSSPPSPPDSKFLKMLSTHGTALAQQVDAFLSFYKDVIAQEEPK